MARHAPLAGPPGPWLARLDMTIRWTQLIGEGETVTQLKATWPPYVVLHVQDDGTDAPIAGNGTQLQQVVLNVCRNAAQAVVVAGKVWIAPPRFLRHLAEPYAAGAAVWTRLGADGGGRPQAVPLDEPGAACQVLTTATQSASAFRAFQPPPPPSPAFPRRSGRRRRRCAPPGVGSRGGRVLPPASDVAMRRGRWGRRLRHSAERRLPVAPGTPVPAGDQPGQPRHPAHRAAQDDFGRDHRRIHRSAACGLVRVMGRSRRSRFAANRL